MPYRIEYSEAARRALYKLPRVTQRRLVTKIEGLMENPRPHGAIKLSGRDFYRLRAGDYRVIYAIADDKLVVIIIEIGHRREIYREI